MFEDDILEGYGRKIVINYGGDKPEFYSIIGNWSKGYENGYMGL